MAELSLSSLLQERAERQPDAAAYTFLDYDADPNGVTETLSWAQVHQRARAIAEELSVCGASGGRVAILAPQGLEYVLSFFGALLAGSVAVPLPAPQFGARDERVQSALRDCAPSAILTTLSAEAGSAEYAKNCNGHSDAAVIAVDSLDLDVSRWFEPARTAPSRPAYLQYTSGSTRNPAGAVISHRNVIVNIEQAFADYLGDVPPTIKLVSWLPLYHDMGLVLGVCGPLVTGRAGLLTSPFSFLQRPARWMQMLAADYPTFSAAPNFAFELALRRTSDDDMAGRDLGNVRTIISGAERVHAATIKRFIDRFARSNLKSTAVRPSYGLAEATVYVASADADRAPKAVRFDYEKLSQGHAKVCGNDEAGSTELIGHGTARSTVLRIVDPETRQENPAGKVGEIWVHGENVANGYWQKPEETEQTFGGYLRSPAPGTAEGPWLRTGDLGVISEGELFIIGRMKDLLIVDGSNHYPDDIEATVQEITGGRVAAISVPDDHTEQLVVIAEIKQRCSDDEHKERLRSMKRETITLISKVHRLRVADLVFVTPGSIPITTSGKIRRSACVERYGRNDFDRADVTS